MTLFNIHHIKNQNNGHFILINFHKKNSHKSKGMEKIGKIHNRSFC